MKRIGTTKTAKRRHFVEAVVAGAIGSLIVNLVLQAVKK